MEGSSSFSLLFEDFPELRAPEAMLEKEVLAHFGLLFSGYALLETGLQNCYIFWQLRTLQSGGRISDQAAWEVSYDFLERHAHASTFGTLLKLLSNCVFLSAYQGELDDLKKKRDYFAHHFFREENDKMFSRAAMLQLIDGMDSLRRRVKVAEQHVDSAAFAMISEIYPGVDLSEN
ncbi:hypothetical protein EYE42_13390 [Paracoccus subflavus]|uniref:Uncharacterized protein n=1 Tax=Paracoccus subflavus TaxID=2528244 RepID=A0A4Q9FWK4_9RHOB|nr:hypothetical protein [Paracoccus subflavus]TBN38030.1 hypothetical protein EYE42_13390 [Paracoccus subflavus]